MLENTIDPPTLEIRPIDRDALDGDLVSPSDPLFGLVWVNPDRMHGTPCFYGTRVPVVTLFHVIAGGGNLEEFLDDFEGVARDQALGVLELALQGLMGRLDSLENSSRSQRPEETRPDAAGV